MRRVLLVLVLMTLSGLIWADLEIGVKGGFVSANYTGSDASSALDSKAGFSIGGFADYDINERLTIQPELLVTTKGTKREKIETDEVGFGGDNFSMDQTLTYVQLPLLIRYNFKSTDTVSPFVFAGPAASINTAAKTKIENDDDDDTYDNEDIRVIDVGFILGGGFEYNRFTFDIRYDRSISKLYDYENPGKIYNSALSFLVGFKIS
jgi:opacity protein-like surface antigen